MTPRQFRVLIYCIHMAAKHVATAIMASAPAGHNQTTILDMIHNQQQDFQQTELAWSEEEHGGEL